MLEPLRHKPFRYLALGRLVTMIGHAVAPIALAFAVLDLTGSVRDLGLVVGLRSLVNVLFLLFAGVLADRLPRTVLMVVSSAIGALTQAVAAALVLTGLATIPLLLVVSAVNGAATALAFPSASALVSQTVPASLLQQANAINRLGMNGGMIAGAALGGIAVAAVGPGWGLAADAAAFAFAALAFAAVRVDQVQRRHRQQSVLVELREGWSEFSSRTWVWTVVLGFLIVNAVIAGGVHVLGPAIADASIGRSAWGFVLGSQTVGMVVGGLIALRVRTRRLLLLGVLCVLLDAPLLAALGGWPRLWVLVAAAFVAGVAIEQFAIAWETSLQQHVPADRLARVYSYDAVGSFVAVPLGQIAAGPTALWLGNEYTLMGAAGLVVLAVLGMLLSRDVRRLEYVTTAPKMPTELPPATAQDPAHQGESRR